MSERHQITGVVFPDHDGYATIRYGAGYAFPATAEWFHLEKPAKGKWIVLTTERTPSGALREGWRVEKAGA